MGAPKCMTSFNPEYRKELNEAYAAENLHEVNPNTLQRFLPEVAAGKHPRYLGIAQSIRERRTEKVCIKVPLFKDEKTDMNVQTEDEPFPGQVYMDAMHFGMGCSSL